MTTIIWCLALSVLGYFIYKWATKNNDFFKKKGLKYHKPLFLLGNTGTGIFRRISLGSWLSLVYNKFPSEKIIGIYDFRSPIYLVRDPELIKKLTVKEFDHFLDHPQFIDSEQDPLLGNALSLLTGQKWRDMRTTLSPAFTGSKMRQMFEFVTDCGEQMGLHYRTLAKQSEVQILDMKEIFSRFTTDVIATCAFGIKVDSFEQKDNKFFKMGKDVMNINTLRVLQFTMMQMAPKLSAKLNIKFLTNEISNFFCSLILDTMSVRAAKNIIRPDMINILMQVRKGNLNHESDKIGAEGFATVDESQLGKTASKREWNDKELIAQCLVFFLAGFDTSSTLLSFLSNELALNPDVQEKLHDEIMEVHENLNGKTLTYETMQSMKYMDMVVSETLRKWTPAPITNRECTKDYELVEDDGFKIEFKKKEQIWIPIYALHHDPKYFPNPERFDPERFNEENVSNIVSGTYLPFGIGPRNCIGSRFALMQVKGVLYYLLQDFKFEICAKTVVPLNMGSMVAMPSKGIHLGLRIRENHRIAST